ncbi:hypothetical protein CQ007_13100 [Pseudomonas sp. MYb185]|nr:hypothetical protein CQ007_13100 [Pseudomonas sp. MYb185]
MAGSAIPVEIITTAMEVYFANMSKPLLLFFHVGQVLLFLLRTNRGSFLGTSRPLKRIFQFAFSALSVIRNEVGWW